MKYTRVVTVMVTIMALVGLLLPYAAYAAPSSAPAQTATCSVSCPVGHLNTQYALRAYSGWRVLAPYWLKVLLPARPGTSYVHDVNGICWKVYQSIGWDGTWWLTIARYYTRR